MTQPKMILFDYGHTLIYEEGFDIVAAAEAVLEFAVRNRDNATVEGLVEQNNRIYKKIRAAAYRNGIEVHSHIFDRYWLDYFGIEVSLDPYELEQLLFSRAVPYRAMEGAAELLRFLENRSIRTGVISNLSFSSRTLGRRLADAFPNHRFEFIITSSEAVFRKPDPMIFELALRKAGLTAEDVWYCGDSTHYDVHGAHEAGIFPVWYDSDLECSYRDPSLFREPDFGHLHIKGWAELAEHLTRLIDATPSTAGV